MIPHKTLGSGISGTVRYVMGEGKRDPVTGKVPELIPGETSRVDWYSGTGFGFPIDSEQRIDIARRVMEWAAQNQASKTKQCREDCLHLALSWDPGENPSRGEMEAAAHSALQQLGMANARALFVAHNDTDHRHLHLVISRIDPETGKAFPDRFDTVTLSAWALQWEREHGGVRCEARLDRERQQAEIDPEKVLAAFFARRETFTVFDLNRELTKAIPARDTRRAHIGAVLARPEIVALADPANGQVMRYTTRQTLAAEQLASLSAERLAADPSHRVSEKALQSVIRTLEADGKTLRVDQMQAWRHATDAEGLAIITGLAGTGKTFAMSAIAAAYRAEGYEAISLAFTNKVVTGLKRTGLDAATLHSMLGRLDRGDATWNGRTLVMVDEAAMVSTRLMARLLSHAEHAGAKVVLIGDDKQLASMERGGMFGYLAGRYGAGVLEEITRQHGAEQRELARRASRYDFKAALTALEAQGGLVTVRTAEDRATKAAELWGQRSAAAPESSLFVITVSNAEALAVNLAIRDLRRGRGELGPDCVLPTAAGPQAFAEGDRILFSGTAGTRDGRAAGLVNGNAGMVTGIVGKRITVALDGARAGERVSFTVGPDHEAGAFDAIQLGYAGTIYKAQGATYDHAIVLDSPMMRANSAYVALTRHRESVTVVTASETVRGRESWIGLEGGIEALTPLQRAGAERAYETWRVGNAAAQRHGLADYVAYVQTREAERRREIQISPIDEMAERWRRIEDRRAASRFVPLDYQAPVVGRLTPEAVRAAVGDDLQMDAAKTARPHEQAANENLKPRPAPGPMHGTRAMLEGPSDHELSIQAERERQFLDYMQKNQQRAQEAVAREKDFLETKEQEAEEARKQKFEQDAADAREARNGDVSNASARYSIALGNTYDIRDPYGSLARAAGAEGAAFHKSQEALRAEAAKEPDADKRNAIELRRRIEGCEYMAITSDRLAGITLAITGRSEHGQAVKDRQSAVHYRATAAALREERSALLEAVHEKNVRVEKEQPAQRLDDRAVASVNERRDAHSSMPTPVANPAPAAAASAAPSSQPEPSRAAPATIPPPPDPAVEKAAAKEADASRVTARFGTTSFKPIAPKPYAVTMPTPAPASAPAPIAAAPAPVSIQPEPPKAQPTPSPVPAPVAPPAPMAEKAEVPREADKATDTSRLTPQLATTSFRPIAPAPYAVTMPAEAAPSRSASPSATAPFDVKPQSAATASPAKAAEPDPTPAPVKEQSRQTSSGRIVEGSAEDHAAARAAGVMMRRVSTPTAEPTNTKGVTKTIEITDRKAAAATDRTGTVRKSNGPGPDPEHDLENGPGGGGRR